jgi:hypothetical protein
MWPGEIIRQLRTCLPPGFVAEPRAHLGACFEIDVSTYESDDVSATQGPRRHPGELEPLLWEADAVVAVETDLADEHEYAVRVYDVERERTLVAAIELVSPANKDRPERRARTPRVRTGGERRVELPLGLTGDRSGRNSRSA